MRTLLLSLLCLLATPAFAAPQLDKLTLPKGFHIAVYSDQVPNAREIAQPTCSRCRMGSLLVSDDLAGAVYRVTYKP
ncbi:hypothetical protein [Rhodanobacter koreensis]